MGLQNSQTWSLHDKNVDNNHKQETQKRAYENVIHNFKSSTTTPSKQKNRKNKINLSSKLAA
jgi:hypothetical protein